MRGEEATNRRTPAVYKVVEVIGTSAGLSWETRRRRP
jgi:hypothetical protein